MKGFRSHRAFLVGIDAYGHGVAPLRTPVADARAVAQALSEAHGFDVTLLLDEQADLAGMRRLLVDTLPEAIDKDDRLLLYFAGHGIALDGDDGPEGFLVPQDARPEERASLLPMMEVHDALVALPCRHSFLVLDCCFAGSFRWASTRSFRPVERKLYRKRYDRFLSEPACQVLTSAAHDQEASDVVGGLRVNHRDEGDDDGEHSPFALALLGALRGAGDLTGPNGEKDGVITCSELYVYLREQVEMQASRLQTPGLWPLRKHGRGEFIFHVPGQEVDLAPDPVLDEAANPWRGLAAYAEADVELFFGRTEVVTALRERVLADEVDEPLTALIAPSGAGKSSVIQAGLVVGAKQHADDWTVVGPLRPGAEPVAMLEQALAELEQAPAEHRRLLIFDQLEELFTMCRDPAARESFTDKLEQALQTSEIRVLIGARADFEPQLAATVLGARVRRGRFLLPPMTSRELREVAEGPALRRVIYFEPAELVDALVDEVSAVPGGLPLLSFTLSEMYRRYLARGSDDRALTRADYDALGGVVGSLRSRATELHDAATAAEQATLRRVILRMVSVQGGELARRRVSLRELTWDDEEENERISRVLERFTAARLLVRSTSERDGQHEPFVEPAHDTLVLGWDKIHEWLDGARGEVTLRRATWRAAVEWEQADQEAGLLWDGDPRLPQLAVMASAGEGRAGGSGDDDGVSLNALEQRFVVASLARESAGRRRRRAIASAVVAVIAVAAAVSLVLYQRWERSRANAAEQAQLAQQRARQARDSARMAAVRQQIGDPTIALALLREVEQPSETRGWVSAATQVLSQPLAQVEIPLSDVQLHPHLIAIDPGGQTLVRFTPAGKGRAWRLASPEEPITLPGPEDIRVIRVVLSADGQVAVSATSEAAHLHFLDRPAEPVVLRPGVPRLTAAAVSHDGTQVALLAKSGELTLHSTSSPGEPPELLDRLTPPIRKEDSVVFSPDAQWLAVADRKLVRLYSLGSDGSAEQEPTTLERHEDTVSGVVFSSQGRVLTFAFDKTARLWSLAGQELATLPHPDRVWSAVFTPAGDRMATGCGDGQVRVWSVPADVPAEDAPQATPELALQADPNAVVSLAFDPAGRLLLAGSIVGSVRVWDTARRSGSPLSALSRMRHVLAGHSERVAVVRWLPDGQVLTASTRSVARTWVLDRGRTLEHEPPLEWAFFSPDGAQLVTIAADGMWVWPLAADGQPWHVSLPDAAFLRAQFSPDGERVFTTASDDTLRVFRVGQATPTAVMPKAGSLLEVSHDGQSVLAWELGQPAAVWPADGRAKPQQLVTKAASAVFDEEGRRVAVCGATDHDVRVFDLARPAEPVVLGKHDKQCTAESFSPDGQHVLTWSKPEGTIRVWPADGRSEPIVRHTNRNKLAYVAFSPDGADVMACSYDGTVRIWSLATLASGEATVLRHRGAVHLALYSPDGRSIITAAEQPPLALWDPSDPSEPVILATRAIAPATVALSDDGRRLAAGGPAGVMHLWDTDLSAASLQARLARATPMCLSRATRVAILGESDDVARERWEQCRTRFRR